MMPMSDVVNFFMISIAFLLPIHIPLVPISTYTFVFYFLFDFVSFMFLKLLYILKSLFLNQSQWPIYELSERNLVMLIRCSF